jgi:hypothetical protein
MFLSPFGVLPTGETIKVLENQIRPRHGRKYCGILRVFTGFSDALTIIVALKSTKRVWLFNSASVLGYKKRPRHGRKSQKYFLGDKKKAARVSRTA